MIQFLLLFDLRAFLPILDLLTQLLQLFDVPFKIILELFALIIDNDFIRFIHCFVEDLESFVDLNYSESIQMSNFN